MAWGRLRPENRSIRLPAATTVVTKSETTKPQHDARRRPGPRSAVMTCASLEREAASCCSVPAAKKATAPAKPILSIIGIDELENGGQIVTQATERTKASTRAMAKAAERWNVIPVPPAPWVSSRRDARCTPPRSPASSGRG